MTPSIPSPLERFLREQPDTYAFHALHPDTSSREYIRKQHSSLSREVSKKHKIYLDQNYWIYCRDAAQGRPQNPLHSEIWDSLKHAVQSGKVVCPASFSVLEEIMKQDDALTRRATASIVQELSCGIALHPFETLLRDEIKQFICTALSDSNTLSPESVPWTYLCLMFQAPLLSGENPKDCSNEASKKALFDLVRITPFPLLIEALGTDSSKVWKEDVGFCDRQNGIRERHGKDFSTFREVYLQEVRGVILSIQGSLEDICWNYSIGHSNVASKPDLRLGASLLSQSIYQYFASEDSANMLPGVGIISGINAAMRHMGQLLRKGDVYDQFHAWYALAYCDAFFTERSLGNLICSRPLRYDTLHDCVVAWNAKDVLHEIERIMDD